MPVKFRRAFARTGLLMSAGAIVLSVGLTVPASAVPSVPNHPYCDPGTSYKLNKKQGYKWYRYDGGTVKNSSKKATAHKTFSHTSSESKTTTKSGEVGLSIKVWIADINAKYGYSVAKTVSYTKTDTFTVDVPPKTTVKYQDGIIVRKFQVKIVHLYDNCTTKTSYGHVYAADNLSTVKDV
jgi:hypothetical protein